MPTAVVTGGAGFLGSHLCDHLVSKAPRDLHRQPGYGLAPERRAPAGRRVPLHQPGRDAAPRDRRAGRFRLSPRALGEPDRLPAAAAALAQGRLVRDAQRARAREVQACAVPARVDERGLRRPAGSSAAGDLLGQREPDRPARRLRRGQALRRGDGDGVPPPAGRRHVHRRGSSTRTARGCARTTAAQFRRLCARRSRTSRSPCSATARRRAASVTWTTSSAGSSLLARVRRAPAGQHRQSRPSSRCSSWPRR